MNTQEQAAFDLMREAYANAWMESFTSANPFHTVFMDAEDLTHIEAGLRAALAAANAVPKPTVPDNSQEWKGMDGTTAFHLITRHADGWADVGKMMGEWLTANREVQPQAQDNPCKPSDNA